MVPDLQGEEFTLANRSVKLEELNAKNRNTYRDGPTQKNNGSIFLEQQPLEELHKIVLIFTRKGTTPNFFARTSLL